MTPDAKTVTVAVIKLIHPNFKTVTVTVIWGKEILKNNKTAGNHFDSNGKSCNCNCREFLRIPEGNCFLQQHSARKQGKSNCHTN